MKRVVLFGLFVAVLLSGCSNQIQLNGMYSGNVYSSGYYIGAMAIDVTSAGSTFSGTGCFVGIDLSTACNTVYGTLGGSNVSFSIGALNFSGSTNGSTITTTFVSDDGTVSGHVTFSTSSTQGLTLTGPSDAESGPQARNFSDQLLQDSGSGSR